MSWLRRIAALALGTGLACAQTPPLQTRPQQPETQLPPEEDVIDTPKEYEFNPVQSKREVEVGKQYLRKGNFKAAANRFLEATKWNDGNAEAWLRLADAEEKKHNAKGEIAALEKFLEVSPDSKDAADARRRLAKLKS